MRICTRTPSPRIARWVVLSPDLHWLLAGERLSHWLGHSPAQGRGGCHQLSHCQAPSAASGGCGSAQGALPPPQTWSRLSADLLRFLLRFPGSPPTAPRHVPSDQSSERQEDPEAGWGTYTAPPPRRASCTRRFSGPLLPTGKPELFPMRPEPVVCSRVISRGYGPS